MVTYQLRTDASSGIRSGANPGGAMRQIDLPLIASLATGLGDVQYLHAAYPLFDLLQRAEVPRVIILTFLTGLATWATVVAVDAARRRTPHVERLYRAVFA
jgi:hypothetical protein